MKRSHDDFSDVSDELSDTERLKITFISEHSVVKSADREISPDDWPIIDLEDATIYHQDGRIANLLNAELQGPFRLRGRIQDLCIRRTRFRNSNNPVLMRSTVKKKKYNGSYIEVPNCYVFSIGCRPTALWAEGEGGWYKIIPSPAYYEMFKFMIEAIDIYYYITEAYEDCLSKKKRMTGVGDLLFKVFPFQRVF